MIPRSWFERPALEVAPDLLGTVLRHRSADGPVAVRITEVEAYAGEGEDPGSHAHRGRTRRNEVMFGPAGHLYAYFTYGMHTCANLVCSPAGTASAVLIRAGEVVEGAHLAALRRRGAAARDLARGPARLCVALGVVLAEDGADVLDAQGDFDLEPARGRVDVAASPRTGVSGAGGTAAFPWRFFVPGEPSVSPYRVAVRPR